MRHIDALEKKVKALYVLKNPHRAEWADWLIDHHVLVVADYATKLAKKYGANEELARVSALLHDIADTQMLRSNPKHAATSLHLARTFMNETGFADEEIKLVVDDAIRYHSCHNGDHPTSQEGKILATADAIAHLKTDFYLFTTWAFAKEMSLTEIKKWTLEKIERDFHKKIFFEEIRKEVHPDYERIKTFFSR